MGVVYRRGKNNYQWKGLKEIYGAIQKIYEETQFNESEEN